MDIFAILAALTNEVIKPYSEGYISNPSGGLNIIIRAKGQVIEMEQLIAHLFGDYVIQSHWMAIEKQRRTFPALLHAMIYGLAILFITQSASALFVIVITHFIIDRWRIARYVVWLKNFIGPRSYWVPWRECRVTGYPDSEPIWLTKWLYIAADNAIHLLINYLSIAHL